MLSPADPSASRSSTSPGTPPRDLSPEGTDPEVVTVLLAVPEIVPAYLQLAADADDDPGAAAVFEALADLVVEVLADTRSSGAVLARCLGAVEDVAGTSPDAEELVGWSFLDALGPAERSTLAPLLGPATRALADAADGPGLR